MLDPATAIEPKGQLGWHLLLPPLHAALVVPRSRGVFELLDQLRAPSRRSELIEEYGELSSVAIDRLIDHGFVWRLAAEPTAERFLDQRIRADRGRSRARFVARVSPHDDLSELAAGLQRLARPPILMVAVPRLSDAARVWRELAQVKVHSIAVVAEEIDAVELSQVPPAATVIGPRIERWEESPLPLLELARAGVRVDLRLPLRAVLAAHEECVEWCRRQRVTAIELSLDGAERGYAEPDDDLLATIMALEEALPGTRVHELATTDELLGRTQLGTDRLSAIERSASTLGDLRARHLSRAVDRLRAREGVGDRWAQTREAEERHVPPAHDLLPADPALVGLFAEATVVEVCGGLGRVARRLAPHVGVRGRVLSFDLDLAAIDRGCELRAESGFAQVDLRPGLAEHLPLADASADVAVTEWPHALLRSETLTEAVREMVRVLRPGGRLAATFRLCGFPLDAPAEVHAAEEATYARATAAFSIPELEPVERRLWAIENDLAGLPLESFLYRPLPRLLDPSAGATLEVPRSAEVFLTLVASKR